MVAKLSTTINKIQSLPNFSNSKIITEFLMYMKNNGSSERHQNNNLNVIIEFSNFFVIVFVTIICFHFYYYRFDYPWVKIWHSA